MNTPRTKLSASLSVLFLSLLLVASCQGKSKEPTAAGSSAARRVEVVFAQGEVRADGAAIDIGALLGNKVRIETGKGARCDLVFGGPNVLSIGQNAVAVLDFSSPAIGVRLEKGGITSVLRKLEKLADRDSFDISTGQAVAGVRGTSFCVWADADSTYICACNGAVHAKDPNGGNTLDLVSAHHIARLYVSKDGKVTVSEAALLHHDDASVQSAATRIGYTIDWTKIE